MNRREFSRITALVSALASGGLLPLLASEEGNKITKTAAKKSKKAGGAVNCFTEPPAIEPVTGYLDGFIPFQSKTLAGDFAATFVLVEYLSATAKSKNLVVGSLELSSVGSTITSTERRKKNNVVKNVLQCEGKFNEIRSWSMTSAIDGMPEVTFTETGTCDDAVMTVKSKSWTQIRATTLPLIGRWALPGLIASDKIKNKPFRFDMLDDSTIRPDQTLKYCGEIEIQTKNGTIKLDCYAQTGCAILPTHYLVDYGGRVQLITQEIVNWVLTEIV